MTPLDMLSTCAPMVSPVTIAAVIQHESQGNPLALHDNTTHTTYQFQTEAEAIAMAKSLIALNHSIDMGMGQINNKNLSWLGQTVDTIFKPCINIAATQTVLLSAWQQSGGNLPTTLSIYNTGKPTSRIGANYAASIYDKAKNPDGPTSTIPAIPNGKLPKWATQELPKNAKTSEITPETFRKTTFRYGAIRGARRILAQNDTQPHAKPANSALRPNTGDLYPKRD